MNLGQYERHIQYLFEAARTGTMRAASERLNVATSSISRQIAFLEAELGTPLLERGRRSIKLTEAGELLIRYYREKQAHDEVYISELQELRGNRSGHIILAIGEGFVSPLFSRILHQFTDLHSNISLSINIESSNKVLQLVRDDEAHIGMVFHSPPDPKIRTVITVPQPLKVIVHPDDPMAQRASIKLSDLAEYRLALPDQSFRIREMLSPLEMQAGERLSPIMTTNSLALLKQFVKDRQGVSILSEIVVFDELAKGELIAVPLDHLELQTTKFQIVTRLGRLLPIPASNLLKTIETNLRAAFRNQPAKNTI
ncbi:LysR family transcriptional regulator [Govanella unica]|uniref:LysR family transcriptional regulator n=1 Tax=Govanella unica TaxID=2975056 RepID=A0A9X3TXG7_9PROT|nr:LysR family transcriptional regulator [Govania unica]MDA5193463.1 LysR family transcriptional regulator [Govania unica]